MVVCSSYCTHTRTSSSNPDGYNHPHTYTPNRGKHRWRPREERDRVWRKEKGTKKNGATCRHHHSGPATGVADRIVWYLHVADARYRGWSSYFVLAGSQPAGLSVLPVQLKARGDGGRDRGERPPLLPCLSSAAFERWDVITSQDGKMWSGNYTHASICFFLLLLVPCLCSS